jgi:hypothetical protein
MSIRLASFFAAVALLVLCGCVDQSMELRHFTSAQVSLSPTDADAEGRPLSAAQVTALSNWINARDDWSGLTINEPDNPTMRIHLQNAEGLSSNLLIYQHENSRPTAYLHYGNRLAPLVRHLSDADMTTLNAIVNGQ